jgi:uncharacterized membrane protein
MGVTLKAAIGALAYMVLDGLWLGVLMKTFYRDQLRQWPFVLTLADVAWGIVASATAASAVRVVVR